MKIQLAIYLLCVIIIASCTRKEEINYQEVPFIEMSDGSFLRIFPDAFLYTRNSNATAITVSRISNLNTMYKDTYKFDSTYGYLTSMSIYSDGDNYISEYGFDKSKLLTEIEYLESIEKKILHSYSYKYSNKKRPAIDKVDINNRIVRSYDIIFNKDKTLIQKYNTSNELDYEYIYLYDNGKLITITTVGYSTRDAITLTTNIHYFDDRIIKTESYSESKEKHEILSQKEYQYDKNGKLTSLTQTNNIYDGSVEIIKTVFKDHDSYGNWTICESDNNRVYIREIFYP